MLRCLGILLLILTMGPGRPLSPGKPRKPGGPSFPGRPAGPGSPCNDRDKELRICGCSLCAQASTSHCETSFLSCIIPLHLWQRGRCARRGNPSRLLIPTLVPSFPVRPGRPCSPGGPGGPGCPRSPIGPVSPVGP